MKNVNIHLGPGIFDVQVEVDGAQIANHVSAMQFGVNSRGERTLIVEFPWFEAEIAGTMAVGVPESTHEALLALGWTPPRTDKEE